MTDTRQIRRVLIANRGEIARRVVRACRGRGIESAAVYSEPDRTAPHVTDADVAVAIGGATAAQSYLDIDRVVDAAQKVQADAIHPGYGFLAENAEFAAACLDAGLTWIGPPPAVIRSMGAKVEAKRVASEAGVPVVPSMLLDDNGTSQWRAAAEQLGYPLLVKASAGGGGKGMRRVDRSDDLVESIQAAQREAQASFGDPAVFLEKWLDRPRHVEVQVLADDYGNVVHLLERECSIQRRHQKIIEEAPAPNLSDDVRRALHAAGVAVAKAVGYVNAGTVEFLVAGNKFFFLEMNTRLQVEHPVTEEVCGLDLVELQLHIAAGNPLPSELGELRGTGHAVEARLYAEDPAQGFLPSVGRIDRFAPDPADDARWEVGVVSGSDVTSHYDPLVAKVVCHGERREDASARLARALRGLQVHGVTTNRDTLVAILESDAFFHVDLHTEFLTEHPELLDPETPAMARRDHAVVATMVLRHRRSQSLPQVAPAGWRNLHSAPAVEQFSFGESNGEEIEVKHQQSRDRGLLIEVDGELVDVRPLQVEDDGIDLEIDGVRRRYSLHSTDQHHWINGGGWQSELIEVPRFTVEAGDVAGRGPTAPVPGTVTHVAVEPGQRVEPGDLLVILEAMKMEHQIVADASGIVERLFVTPQSNVEAHELLVEIQPAE